MSVQALARAVAAIVMTYRTGHFLLAAATAFALLFAVSAASAATIHIVAFGDSATAGFLVPRQ